MKLLAPAGNLESLKTAVFGGTDEIYLGVREFNARNNIEGFSLDTLKEGVDFAHLYGARVFLAINILFTDNEIQSALNVVCSAYNLGVDAFIVQDIGLATVIRENYPQIELHASTQMGIHNLEGALQIEKLGFKRVVLARETPLDEIKRIKENSSLEIEYFVHGALCVSFSGNCYLSSYTFDASGNRGRCKQPCRLPYKLNYKGKTLKRGYLLSAKDFNMIDRLTDLEEAGVTSLKIEGRARRPYYVGAVTREYRKALDGLSADKQKLALAFNREFTEGYFNGNGKIISSLQNHIGLDAGKVERVNFGKKFNEVYILSPIKLNPKSVLKFTNGEKEILTLSAYDLRYLGSNRYVLTTTKKVREGLLVRLISNVSEEEELLKQTTKRSIEVTLSLRENQPISATLSFGVNKEKIEGETLLKPITRPLEKEEVEECFRKSEIFRPKIIFDKFEPVFMPKSTLNEFRRKVYAKAVEILTSIDKRRVEMVTLDWERESNLLKDFCYAEDEKGIYSNKTVIYSPEVYSLKAVEEFVKNCKEQGVKPYLDLPNFALKEDVSFLREIVNKTGIGIVANNYYALALSDDVIIGGGLNVYNSISASVYNKPIILSENGVGEETPFPYMTLRHCPIKTHVGGDCANCKYKDGYEYVMENGKTLKLKRKKISDCTFYLV